MKKFLAFIIVAAMAVSSAFAADSAADQKRGKKSKAELKEVTWTVNLHCENCVEKVNENLAFEKGVKDMKVSLADQTVMLKYDSAKTSAEKLKAAIEKLGYPVAGVVAPGHENCGHDHGHDHGHGHNHAH